MYQINNYDQLIDQINQQTGILWKIIHHFHPILTNKKLKGIKKQKYNIGHELTKLLAASLIYFVKQFACTQYALG